MKRNSSLLTALLVASVFSNVLFAQLPKNSDSSVAILGTDYDSNAKGILHQSMKEEREKSTIVIVNKRKQFNFAATKILNANQPKIISLSIINNEEEVRKYTPDKAITHILMYRVQKSLLRELLKNKLL